MPIRCLSDLGALALLLALAGCVPGGREAPLPPVGEAAQAKAQASCEARGGRWLAFGAAFYCVTPTKDGGQSCRTGADCAGACLARSMTCAPAKPLLGCNEVIGSGGLRGMECVD